MQAYIDIVDSLHETLTPPTALEFFERGFGLTSDDRFKNFKLEYSPWIKTLLLWCDDPDISYIFPIQGSQTSKTTFMMGHLLYVSQYASGACPVLWVQSTEDEAKQFITERLRYFLDGDEKSRIKKWKQEAFRVNNAAVKVGYATTRYTLRSKPARFIYGDETGIWKETIAYVKKRMRTFKGIGKGIFATTPPESKNHHSWVEATSGNFFQWWVPCPKCGFFQGLRFQNIKFENCKTNGDWDFSKIRKNTRYQCCSCGDLWNEGQKLEIINNGRHECVDKETYEPVPVKITDSYALQVSSLYSVFTSWGQLACEFIGAKKAGPAALKIFITDELAEVPGDMGQSLKKNELRALVDISRPSGYRPGYDLYTAGADVQTLGQVYYVVLGWKKGLVPSAHVLKYGVVTWRDSRGLPNFSELIEINNEFQQKIKLFAIDASNGVDMPHILDFARWSGLPFMPIKETNTQANEINYKLLDKDPITGHRLAFGNKLLQLNTHLIKDHIAAALGRRSGDPGAWSFPADTDDTFFTHIQNEHRVEEKRRGRIVSIWKPKYSKAPQHLWSAYVYAVAGHYEQRLFLHQKPEKVTKEPPKKASQGGEYLRNYHGWRINR